MRFSAIRASIIPFLTVPSGPPLNFNAMSTNPTVLTLSWQPPEEAVRNGIITNYSYSCENVHTEPQVTLDITVDVTGLTAFTLYTCIVRAATVNGTGPSVEVTGHTAEDSRF